MAQGAKRLLQFSLPAGLPYFRSLRFDDTLGLFILQVFQNGFLRIFRSLLSAPIQQWRKTAGIKIPL
jgi:hypothetical protein